VRPSPASGTLGGVAAKTRESMLICEAAGYDVVLVETIGTGQSETMVADMTDFFLVLMLPGAGDELQGLKKGVVEIADMIAINKADGDNLKRAKAAAAEYRAALHILNPRSPSWSPPVVTYSALTGDGVAELWASVLDHRKRMSEAGEFDARRREQQVKWMWAMLEASSHRGRGRGGADVTGGRSRRDCSRVGRLTLLAGNAASLSPIRDTMYGRSRGAARRKAFRR